MFVVSLHPKALLLDISFMRPYDSVRREGLCNSLTEFSIPMKLVRPVKMYLNNRNYSRAWVGKHSSDMFRIKNGLKQGDALSLLLFNFTLEYTGRMVQANKKGLKLNGTHKFLVHADDTGWKHKYYEEKYRSFCSY